MKICVAIPVYDGKLPAETVRCLLNEQAIAIGSGDQVEFRFLPNCSHPAMGRNQLTNDFMESDCERLVFVDADVTFTPGEILKLAHSQADFVGGAYRYKQDEESYPVGWLDKAELWANDLGLLEVKAVPGGFLSLSRKVFERLKESHPDRQFEHFGHKGHAYFLMPFSDGHLYGEDSFFCKEWREAGGAVYLDPELTLTHWDFNKPYPGHIGNWLKRRAVLTQNSERKENDQVQPA